MCRPEIAEIRQAAGRAFARLPRSPYSEMAQRLIQEPPDSSGQRPRAGHSMAGPDQVGEHRLIAPLSMTVG